MTRAHTIENAPGLSEAPQKELAGLRATTSQRMARLNETSFKLRALLIQEVVAPENNTREVRRIQKRIKATENEKLSLMFDAVTQANRNLGKEAKQNSELIEHLVNRRERI